MTDDRLASIEQRLQKITPGPHEFNSYNTIFAGEKADIVFAQIPDHPQDDGPYEPEEIAERSAWYRESANNADFIASAPSDIRYLLDELQRLRAESK